MGGDLLQSDDDGSSMYGCNDLDMCMYMGVIILYVKGNE